MWRLHGRGVTRLAEGRETIFVVLFLQFWKDERPDPLSGSNALRFLSNPGQFPFTVVLVLRIVLKYQSNEHKSNMARVYPYVQT